MHLIEKKWNIAELSDEQKALTIDRRILCARGMTEKNQQDAFMSDQLIFHDPFLLPDMNVACDRVLKAVHNKERVLIYGDYDADGVTATAMLVRYFKDINVEVSYLIPNRVSEGYGVSEAVFEDLMLLKPDLVITVDCGIANSDEISNLSQKGMDFIVTDHHEVKDILPEARAVICPKRKDSCYPTDFLCGAGIALKFIQALMQFDFALKVNDKNWEDYADLAMIGTIADVVPLLDENRSIVRLGFDIVQKQPDIGIKTLLNALVDDIAQLNRTTLSFSVIPKINASGRMGDASRAVQLFLSDDVQESESIVRELLDDNIKRQEEEKAILEEAYDQINHLYKTDDVGHLYGAPIVVFGQDWHPGIIGIVASRIVSKYNRSAVVLTAHSSQEGVVKGSARASLEYNILDAIEYAQKHLIQFGGHAKAAGITLHVDKIESFRESLNDYAKNIQSGSIDTVLNIDLEISAEEISLGHWRLMSRLEPFGEGHPEPRFLIRNVIIEDVSLCGEGQHQRFTVRLDAQQSEKERRINIIAFRWGFCAGMFRPNDHIDIVFEMKKNVWRGKAKLDLMALDIRLSKRGHIIFDQPEIPEKLFRHQLPLQSISKLTKMNVSELIPDRSYIKAVYQFIQKRCRRHLCIIDMHLLSDWISSDYQKPYHAFALARVFDIFEEAGLIKVYYRKEMRICFSLLFVNGKVKLENTKTFQLISTSGGAIT